MPIVTSFRLYPGTGTVCDTEPSASARNSTMPPLLLVTPRRGTAAGGPHRAPRRSRRSIEWASENRMCTRRLSSTSIAYGPPDRDANLTASAGSSPAAERPGNGPKAELLQGLGLRVVLQV